MRMASASAASRTRFMSSPESCHEAFTFQVQRHTSASHLSAGRPRSAMPKCAAIMATQGWGMAASSASPSVSVTSSTPSVRPRKSASARCDGIERMGSDQS